MRMQKFENTNMQNRQNENSKKSELNSLFYILCAAFSDYVFRIEIEQAFDVVCHHDKRAAL